MRQYAILFLLLTGAQALFSQEIFHQFFGNSENTTDYAYHMAGTPDGGFIIAGSTTSYGNGQYDAFLMKVAANGSQEWFKTYGDTLDDEGLSVCLAPGGGYVFAGYTEDVGDGKADGWVAHVTNDGTLTWSRKFSIAGVERVTCVRPAPGGKYAVCGNTVTGGFSGQDIFVALLDNNGFPLDNQMIATTGLDEGLFVEPAANGNIAVAYRSGSTYKFTLFSPTLDEIKDVLLAGSLSDIYSLSKDANDNFYLGGQSVVVSITPAGDIAWSSPLVNLPGQVVSIIPAAGQINALAAFGTSAYLWVLDAAGNTLSSEKVTFPNAVEAKCMVFDNAQKPVVLGNVFIIGEQQDFQLLGLSGMQAQPIVLWTKLHGKPGYSSHEYGTAICRAADGGYVVCAERYNEISGFDTWVFKITESGEIVWETSLSFSQNPETRENCYSVEPLGDGGFVLAATTFKTYTLVKLNSTGALLWSKTYTFQSVNPFRAVLKPLPDGGFVGAARIAKPGNPPLSTVLRFNSIGDTLWTRSFGTNSDAPRDLEPIGSDGFVVGGSKRVSTTPSVQLTWLVRIGPNGNIIWERTYGAPSNFARCLNLEIASDGDIVSTGFAYENFSSSRVVRNFVLKAAAATGNLIWERKWSNPSDSAVFYGYNILQAPDGNFYNGGYSAEFADNMPSDVTQRTHKVVAQKIGPDGQEIWRKTAEVGPSAFVYGGAVTADGGYLLCGTAANSISFDVLIVKFGADGVATTEARVAMAPARLGAESAARETVSRIVLKSKEPGLVQSLDGKTLRTWTAEKQSTMLEQELELTGNEARNYFLESQRWRKSNVQHK